MITYEAELNIFKSILGQFNLSVNILPISTEALENSDMGIIGRMTGSRIPGVIEKRMKESIKEKTIYRVTDEFSCCYALMLLPEFDEPTVMVLGPYTRHETDRSWLESFIQEKGIDPRWTNILENHFRGIPRLENDKILFVSVNSLAERIWGLYQFSTEEIISGVPDSFIPLSSPPDGHVQEDVLSRMRKIERAYQAENQFLEAVAQGRIHRASIMLSNFSRDALENRAAPLRNIKNYSIILNTLMRKAVERGGVHPIHIDRVSSEFALKIESIAALEDFMDLWQEMAHKYCLLARSQNTTDYSQLVQYIIARVDHDLTDDLSLKANAEALNVNASYLSSLFKKETGSTLTDYVNRKRIEHAIYLLSSTDIPISAVGQRCGIQDDNYFTKIFKKYTSMSPKQYRQQWRGEKRKPLHGTVKK